MTNWSKVPHTEWPTKCPQCGQALSNTSYEPYCADEECRWNNPPDHAQQPGGFNMLALVAAGTIQEDDDITAFLNGVTLDQSRAIAKWLALTTNTPAKLRFMTIGYVEEIEVTPDEVRAEIVNTEIQRNPS